MRCAIYYVCSHLEEGMDVAAGPGTRGKGTRGNGKGGVGEGARKSRCNVRTDG